MIDVHYTVKYIVFSRKRMIKIKFYSFFYYFVDFF